MPTKAIATGGASKRAVLSRIGQRRQVVIPKEIFDHLRLREGDVMEVTTVAVRLSMRPKKNDAADDVLTRAEASKVRHGLKQMREGKTKAWSDVKHALGL